YQNVSNSQLLLFFRNILLRCKRFCKVIKMLAIHNVVKENCVTVGLQTLLQSYQNVSNSQLFIFISQVCSSCKRFCKVIKMLAIHNRHEGDYMNEQIINFEILKNTLVINK
ncbi:MAG: hypothetical protein WBK27_02740, partial [Bacteroidales bacterium]